MRGVIVASDLIEGVPADAKKPITNPTSIKDFAITKRAQEDREGGGIQPDVRVGVFLCLHVFLNILRMVFLFNFDLFSY